MQHTVDKNFCMSSFLTFRYIERDDMDFFDHVYHKVDKSHPESYTEIETIHDMDRHIKAKFQSFNNEKLGILLSGGMDSGCLAYYMPKGSNAYTFRFLGGEFQKDELKRAENIAKRQELNLHYIDIDWSIMEHLPILMKRKGAPVHSIEPQIYVAALKAKADGVERMIFGDAADPIFGGMDQLISKDWKFDDFVERYTFLDPKLILKDPVDVNYLFERYRVLPQQSKRGEEIDFLRFMDEVYGVESEDSYVNAFEVAGIKYCDPYCGMKIKGGIDLERNRNGQPKYFVRELFKYCYHDIPVPNKNPMPRPVDVYFKDWKGPIREEFRADIPLNQLHGNQKYQLYVLERFLDEFQHLEKIIK
ncbi:asparagine synthase-related protein [Lonepinella sp. BR2357]|uniref:asparagine synthase-related protein n=1 Tax=Lonepinella sp. BR2357 TaxID=3434549 RepID=UPI003F6DB5F4